MGQSVLEVDHLIIDGHNLALRCAFVPGLDTLRDSRGRFTGAIVGFLRSLKSFRKKFPGAEIVVTWDGSSRRRRAMFADYKANRPQAQAPQASSPSIEAFDQIHWLRDTLPFFGVKQVWNPEEEADDVISTLVRKFAPRTCVILSTDRDFLQLVSERVFLYVPTKERLYDAAKILEEYGVPPERILDLKAITGDTSDNIPGVPGFGPKMAQKLICLYKTVDEIYASTFAGVTQTQYKNLRDAEKQVRLNLQLMSLASDVPIIVVEANPDQVLAEARLNEIDVKSPSTAGDD
jgi:DNA polymerase I